MEYVVGIDVGTTSVKATVLSKDCELVFEDQIPHQLITQRANFSEEDPNVWWDSTLTLLKRIVQELKDGLVAIGVSGMVPTLILVDEKGEPIRHSIQQNDARAVEEIEYFKSKIDREEFFERTGNTINQQLIFPKFEWLRRHEPENVQKTRWIMGSYNYITFKLTGKPCLDVNWALESGMWDVKEKRWFDEILKVAGIPKDLLAQVYEPHQTVGELKAEIAEQIGIHHPVAVIAGSADHIASTLGIGAIRDGDLVLKIGGAGDVMYVSDELIVDENLFIDYHDVPGKYVLNGCMAASGSIVRWFSEKILKTDLRSLNEQAKNSPVGSNSLILLPYFLGEKTPIFDAKAKGVWLGLSLNHEIKDLFRSILEAVAYGFMHHIEVIRNKGRKIERVFLCNGGAKSELWRKIVADVTGYDLIYIEENPGSSAGVAFLAGYAVGLFKDWEEIEKMNKRKYIVHCDAKNHELYSRYYKIYRETYESLKHVFEKLYELSAGM
uniref:Carbohydrate kinase n=1 Tax=Pseudothermotoga hypogea TaxID=57487 RepID=A0A832I679_9THEM